MKLLLDFFSLVVGVPV